MKRFLNIARASCFWWIFLLIIGSGCNRSPVNPGPSLPAPVLIQSPADTSLIEIGIDAVESGDFIRLDWQPGDKELPINYRIYRTEAIDSGFVLTAAVSGRATSYLDSLGIKIGTRYYYYITAVDDEDIESYPSDTLSYKLLEKPFLLANSFEPELMFSWQVRVNPEFYVLKLIEADTEKKIWVSKFRTSYTQIEKVKFNFDGKAIVDSLQRGVAYKWRVDIIGASENSGSESPWKRLIIQ
jgi:hypothetical protein